MRGVPYVVSDFFCSRGKHAHTSIPSLDAAEAVKAVPKAIWRKVPTFGRAIGFMISKGESEKPSNDSYMQMLDALEGTTSRGLAASHPLHTRSFISLYRSLRLSRAPGFSLAYSH